MDIVRKEAGFRDGPAFNSQKLRIERVTVVFFLFNLRIPSAFFDPFRQLALAPRRQNQKYELGNHRDRS
jgi:hypothetical protein